MSKTKAQKGICIEIGCKAHRYLAYWRCRKHMLEYQNRKDAKEARIRPPGWIPPSQLRTYVKTDNEVKAWLNTVRGSNSRENAMPGILDFMCHFNMQFDLKPPPFISECRIPIQPKTREWIDAMRGDIPFNQAVRLIFRAAMEADCIPKLTKKAARKNDNL